jgi:leader peptidase (prepilin peptidase) / N-methyltransferase
VTESTLLAILAGLFGLLIGSFLNVCIVRLPADQSVIAPRSRCPQCGKPVEWRDNIPVLSWLFLGGKCRWCRAPIGIMYPLVELVVGLLFALAMLHYGPGVVALKAALFGTLLLGIALTDAREYLIPNEFTWGGLALGLVLSAAGGLHAVLLALLGAAVGFAILWLVGLVGKRVFKEEAMGGGDIKMMAMVGAFLGWQGVLLTIFLGALAGSAIFLPLALVGRKKLVPFGVFLALGAAVTYLIGPAILVWYRRYLGVG